MKINTKTHKWNNIKVKAKNNGNKIHDESNKIKKPKQIQIYIKLTFLLC